MLQKQCVIHVKDIRLWVHMGCDAEEQHHPQGLSVDAIITFREIPCAFETDCLDQTVCYQMIVQSLQNVAREKRLALIEAWAKIFYDTIKKNWTPDVCQNAALTLHVTKLHPPVHGLQGGVTVTYGDHNAL